MLNATCCARKIVSAYWQQHFSWIIAIVDTREPNLIWLLRKVEALTMLRNYEALGQIRCNQVGRAGPHHHISHEGRISSCVSTINKGNLGGLKFEKRKQAQDLVTPLVFISPKKGKRFVPAGNQKIAQIAQNVQSLTVNVQLQKYWCTCTHHSCKVTSEYKIFGMEDNA